MTAVPRYRPNWVFGNTSGYYAAAAEDETRHREAQAILARLQTEHVRFHTTLYVLAELHALVITRRRNPQFALALISGIERSATSIVPVTDGDQARARAILTSRPDKLYSLTDALSFAVMERLGIARVFTFDRNFSQHGFQLVGA
jgi:predicted nucleic acid-binding protein